MSTEHEIILEKKKEDLIKIISQFQGTRLRRDQKYILTFNNPILVPSRKISKEEKNFIYAKDVYITMRGGINYCVFIPMRNSRSGWYFTNQMILEFKSLEIVDKYSYNNTDFVKVDINNIF